MTFGAKFISLLAAGLLSLVALSGCNTIEGLGKDIEASGEALEDAARRNKN